MVLKNSANIHNASIRFKLRPDETYISRMKYKRTVITAVGSRSHGLTMTTIIIMADEFKIN